MTARVSTWMGCTTQPYTAPRQLEGTLYHYSHRSQAVLAWHDDVTLHYMATGAVTARPHRPVSPDGKGLYHLVAQACIAWQHRHE